MRFFLAAILAPVALVSAKLAILSANYSAGVLTIDEFAWPDAPAQFDVALVGGGNTTVIESGLTPANGTTSYQIPNTTPDGSYHISLVGAGTNSTEVYSSSKTFTVAASDFNSTTTNTGTASSTSTSTIPPSLVPTASVSFFTTDTVFTSGSITTTIAETESVTVSYTLSIQPTTTAGGSTVAAATATITSKTTGSGAMKLKVPGTVAGVVLGGALMAAAIIL